MKRLLPICLVAIPTFLFVGCYRDNGGTDIDNTNYDAGWVNDCEPWGDDDNDFISNGDEGCMYNRGQRRRPDPRLSRPGQRRRRDPRLCGGR